MMRIKRKFLQPFTRQQHVYQKNGGVDSSNDRLWAPTKGMIGELLCSWNSCSWLDGGKAPNVDAAEMQAFGSKEDDAATKLQSLQRAKSTREVVVKEFMTQTGSCLAMPGTVQGKSGYYEMWANDLDTTLVAKFDVSEEGKWALAEGPWTMKEWVVVKQKNKEWFAARATAALKIQTLSRSKAARNNLDKAVGTQLGRCLAMPGTTQGKSGYYEMWVERYEMKMVAAMIVSEDGDWSLDSGPWTQKEWLVVRRWTPEQQQAAETVRMTMEARNRRTLAAKAMGATAKAVALPGTLQGGSGYYELRKQQANDGQSSTVARYDIDGTGQWMLIEGPWPMNTWKIVQARTPEEEPAAGKAGREAFQAILASRTQRSCKWHLMAFERFDELPTNKWRAHDNFIECFDVEALGCFALVQTGRNPKQMCKVLVCSSYQINGDLAIRILLVIRHEAAMLRDKLCAEGQLVFESADIEVNVRNCDAFKMQLVGDQDVEDVIAEAECAWTAEEGSVSTRRFGLVVAASDLRPVCKYSLRFVHTQWVEQMPVTVEKKQTYHAQRAMDEKKQTKTKKQQQRSWQTAQTASKVSSANHGGSASR
jgi:hypothetical protein